MILTISKRVQTPEECEVLIQKRLEQLSDNQTENINIFYDVLGLTMKKIRIKKGKTQMKVASWLGVTFQQVQKYENGINRTPFHSILIFVEKIKCDISEFTNYFNDITLSSNSKTTQNAKEIEYEQPNA